MTRHKLHIKTATPVEVAEAINGSLQFIMQTMKSGYYDVKIVIKRIDMLPERNGNEVAQDGGKAKVINLNPNTKN